MRRLLASAAGISVVTLFLFQLSGAAWADPGTTQSRADQVAALVNRLAPAPDGASRLGPQARGTNLSVTVPTTSAGKVALARPGEASARLAIALPAGTPKTAATATDGTVAFAAGTGVDVAVQSFDQGVRIATVIGGASSPAEFAYPVDVPAGGSLALTGKGGINVLDAKGTPVGGAAVPWAVDSDGRAVDTHFEVRGTTLVQVVGHQRAGVRYPVVADPFLGIDLIDGAYWDIRDGGWTLFVTPSSWARANGGVYSVGAAGWDELYAKFHNHGLCCNLNAMRDQFICHEVFAFWKPTYNLDEWRPDVGYQATVAAGCNPGGGPD